MARFTRTKPAPIVKGGYGAFRPYVRHDFEECCAYCYLHERHAGGENNFQLDHFKPKHIFPDLLTDFYNLYWSCSVCNGVKGKHKYWPSNELLAMGIGFVDLCNDDFEDHYRILPDGMLEPLTESARFTIKWVRLNNEHLIKLRARLLREGHHIDKDPDA